MPMLPHVTPLSYKLIFIMAPSAPRFPLTITRNSLTFLHPLIPEAPGADAIEDPRALAVLGMTKVRLPQ